MEPIFFLFKRTPRQVRLHAAESFNASNGTFKPMSNRHPQAEEAQLVMNALTIAVRDLPVSSMTPDRAVEGAKRYLLPDVTDRLRVIPANSGLPARIVLRAS